MRIFLVLLIVLLLGVVSWRMSSSDIPALNELKHQILKDTNVVMHGVRLVEKKYNKPSMELVAAKSVTPLNNKETILERFTLLSYSSKSGKITITANKGTLINATKDISASGSVIVRDEQGRAMLIDTLKWDEENRVVTSDDIVRLFGERFVIIGKGLVARPDEEIVEILSNVRATFEPRNEK